MSRITPELKKETKEHILEVAAELFQTQGFQKTTTRIIAKQSGIGEGTLFNYYPTKDDLLIAVFEHLGTFDEGINPQTMPKPLDLIILLALDPVRKMNRIPRVFMLDILISSIKLIKKKPTLFHRLAALDYNYIKAIKDKLEIYGEFKDASIDANDLANMIYGIIAFDFLIHLYESKEDDTKLEADVIRKLKALITPYLKEGLSI
jgi:AcrR family transcriptional regulator